MRLGMYLRHRLSWRVEPPEEKRGPLLPELQGQVGQLSVRPEHRPVIDPQRRVLVLSLLLYFTVTHLFQVAIA